MISEILIPFLFLPANMRVILLSFIGERSPLPMMIKTTKTTGNEKK